MACPGRRRRARAWLAGAALALRLAAPAWADAEKIATEVCAACHGPAGHSAVPTFPVLAGQQADYIAKQLADFQSGKRASDVMAPIVADMKDSDFEALGAYFAAQTPPKSRMTNPVLAAIGRDLYRRGNDANEVPACASCHLDRGEGSERYPRIAGQHADYARAQLKAFQSGARANDKGRAMRIIAERLTDAEVSALVTYLAGL